MTETAYRDYMARQDVKWWTGTSAKTFSRKTPTGGSMTVTKFGNAVDVLSSHGDGIRKTSTEINQAITSAGTNSVSLEIAPGTWDITADVTFPSTANVIFHPGAVFSITTAKTVTFNSPNSIIASPNHQIFSGAGTAAFTYAGTAYPAWWGAKGDGSTNDTTALDAMIDDLVAGSIVEIESGKTYIATLLTVDEELTFTGSGTIKQMDSGASADTAFILVSADNVKFIGITIDGNKTNQGAVTGADLIQYINGADDGEVSNCIVENSTGACVSGYGLSDLRITNNRFNTWRTGNYGAINISSSITGATAASYRVHISGNHVDGSVSDSSCIKIAGSSTYPIYDTVISNNQVIVGDPAADTLGIELWSSSGIGIYRASVTGNTVTAENNTNDQIFGISAAGAGTHEVSIVGNTISNCRTYGIEIAGSYYATVTGNVVRQTNATPLAGYPGIMLNESSNCTVNGNTVTGYIYGIQIYSQNAGTAESSENIISNNAVTLPASTASYGIFAQSNNAAAIVSRNLISCNSIIGDSTALQYGVGLQLDTGTMADTTIASNFFYLLPIAISCDSEVDTHILNNVYKTCTATVGGTAGAGQVVVGQDPVNGTYQIRPSSTETLAVTNGIQNDVGGEGAASSGFIRLKQADYIMFRNEANDNDVVGMYKNDTDKVILGGTAGIGVTSALYIGDGAATNIQAPIIGTGDGPTTAVTVVKWIQIDVSGTVYYIPLMQ